MNESMIYGSRVGLFPELHASWTYLAAKAGLPIPFGGVGAFVTEQIDNRKSGKLSGVEGDFLDKLLKLKDACRINDYDIQTTIGANMAAGSDTTAIASSAIIELLIKHPENAQKLHEELKECRNLGKV
jgi:cytochrome P450